MDHFELPNKTKNFIKIAAGSMLLIICGFVEAAPHANQKAFIEAIKTCDADALDLIAMQGRFDPNGEIYTGKVAVDYEAHKLLVAEMSNDGRGKGCLRNIDKLLELGVNPLKVYFSNASSVRHDGAIISLISMGEKGANKGFFSLLDVFMKYKYVDFKTGIKLKITNDPNSLRNLNETQLDSLNDLKNEPTLLMLQSSIRMNLPFAEVFNEIISKSDINARNKGGKTALMYSVKVPIDRSWLQITKVLLERGADPTIKDKKGNTAFDYAMEYGNIEAAKLLKSFKQSPMQTSSSQASTPTPALAKGQQTQPSNDSVDYTGTYSGTYDGQDSGELGATVMADGSATFWNRPYKIQNQFTGSGKVAANGSAVFIIPGGPTFTGTIAPNGAIEGSWAIEVRGQRMSGNFRGNKTTVAQSKASANPIGGLLNIMQTLPR